MQVDSDEEPLVRSAAEKKDAPVLCAGPSRQLSAGHGSLPRTNHQRVFVVEVAPGVVGVTAVALPSAPNMITCVVKSDVPADEEADQGPTWVDSDDESMDNEPLVTMAEGTTVPIVDSESKLSVRAIRGRFESPPASTVQGSGVLGGNNISQSTTVVQVTDQGMGVSHDTAVEDTVPDVEFAHSDEEGSSEADTETIDGASVGDEEPSGRETTVTVDVTPDFPNFGMVPDQNIAAGFESLDEVDLVSIFNRRANVMRSIPHVLKGPTWALEARVGGNELKLTRSWLFLLLPRMLLFRPPRGGKIPKPQLLNVLQSSRGASGVNWSKKEQFWQRKHTALVAGRDGGRRQMFHAAHTGLCGVCWMGNCLQRDKLWKVQR